MKVRVCSKINSRMSFSNLCLLYCLVVKNEYCWNWYLTFHCSGPPLYVKKLEGTDKNWNLRYHIFHSCKEKNSKTNLNVGRADIIVEINCLFVLLIWMVLEQYGIKGTAETYVTKYFLKLSNHGEFGSGLHFEARSFPE